LWLLSKDPDEESCKAFPCNTEGISTPAIHAQVYALAFNVIRCAKDQPVGWRWLVIFDVEDALRLLVICPSSPGLAPSCLLFTSWDSYLLLSFSSWISSWLLALHLLGWILSFRFQSMVLLGGVLVWWCCVEELWCSSDGRCWSNDSCLP
jgi:hypothetical protein